MISSTYMSLVAGIFIVIVLGLAALCGFLLTYNLRGKRHQEYVFIQSACIAILLFIAVIIALYH